MCVCVFGHLDNSLFGLWIVLDAVIRATLRTQTFSFFDLTGSISRFFVACFTTILANWTRFVCLKLALSLWHFQHCFLFDQCHSPFKFSHTLNQLSSQHERPNRSGHLHALRVRNRPRHPATAQHTRIALWLHIRISSVSLISKSLSSISPATSNHVWLLYTVGRHLTIHLPSPPTHVSSLLFVTCRTNGIWPPNRIFV